MPTSQSRFQAIFDQSAVPTQIYSAEGKILQVNDAWCRWMKVSREKVEALNQSGYCLLEDPALISRGVVDRFRMALEGKTVKNPPIFFNLSEHGLHDQPMWIQSNYYPIPDSSGAIVEVLMQFNDVSDLVKQVDDAKALNQKLLDQTKAVIFVKDLEGKYVLANVECCRIFNRDLHDVIGKDDFELFPDPVAKAVRRHDQRVYETGSHLEVEEFAPHPDGSEHTYIALKFPLNDSAGKLIGICGIATDITQHKQMELKLNTAKRMEAVGLLAGGIAHNFNNILGFIQLMSDSLLTKGDLSTDRLQAFAKSIRQAIQSGSLLTRQLLAFGKKEKSKPVPVKLDEIVLGMKDILISAVGEDIRFSIETAPDTWPILADPMEIEQILANLSLNAKDSMPTGGFLKVQIQNRILTEEKGDRRIGSPAGNYVELSVSDSGCGMDSKTLERMFEPFFTTKKEGPGTGLGLASVYDIVQAHQGDILAESILRNGTTVKVYFPQTTEPWVASQAKSPSSAPPVGGRETVLLVEDQAYLRTVTADVLRDHGYQVLEASDAASAIEIWKNPSHHVDVIITDVVMPGMSGVEMIEKMAEPGMRKPQRVLFVSGYSESKLSAHRLGHTRFRILAKPYKMGDLFGHLREILEEETSSGCLP